MRTSLGTTPVNSSVVGFGCDRLGSILTPLNRRQSIALLREAFDLGFRHFDTASIYGQGDSERYIGEAFRNLRYEVCIATKAGQVLSPMQAIAARLKSPIRLMTKLRGSFRDTVRKQRATGVNFCFEPTYIGSSLDASLRRLQTDRADIFYLHSPPPAVMRDDRLFMLLERQRELGKIGAIGVSCDDLQTALAAVGHPVVEIVQFTLSDDPACREVLETAMRRGKVSLVRGIARRAVQQEGGYEAGLAAGFLSAMSLPSVAGVIVGTIDERHLRRNVEVLSILMRRLKESG